MADTAQGIFKRFVYKTQSTFGTAASGGGSTGQTLRYVSGTFSVKKDTYQGDEVLGHLQQNDMRHGVRQVDGSLATKLSPGTYKDFHETVCGRAYAAVSALTGLSITVAGTGPYTLTRAAGDFLTGGIRIGMVVRLTAGSFTAGNLNNNILVTNVTATVITGVTLNGSSLTAEGPIASATVTVPGKVTYIPSSSHTDAMWTLEEQQIDKTLSKLVDSVKVPMIDFRIPATGMVEQTIGLIGRDMVRNTSLYFTSPTAETTTGIVASVNGRLLFNGSIVAIVTDASISVKRQHQAEAVAGSNIKTEATADTWAVDGSLTFLFQANTIPALFDNETEVSLALALTAGTTANADVITLTLPRIKLNGADEQFNRRNLKITCPFTALYQPTSGIASQQTTFQIQDSQA